MATSKKPRAKAKPKIDEVFTKLLGNQLLNAKGFYDYGIERGLMTPEALRLTVEKRQERSKALIQSGMSQRQAAKALGVSRGTIERDIGGSKKAINGSKKASQKEKDNCPSVLDIPDEGEVETATQAATRNLYNAACESYAFAKKAKKYIDDANLEMNVLDAIKDATEAWTELSFKLLTRDKQKEK